MNDILSEYFTLNSNKSVDKGNGVAIFCAIVSIVACSYSLNMSSQAARSQLNSSASAKSVVEKDPAKEISAQQASHREP